MRFCRGVTHCEVYMPRVPIGLLHPRASKYKCSLGGDGLFAFRSPLYLPERTLVNRR
jgi:hypothetical protein